MPSQFELNLAAQLPAMRDSLGTPGCTATAPDGTITTGLTLRVQREEPREMLRDNRIDGGMQSAVILVLQSDLPNAVKGLRFSVPGLVGEEVWTIAADPLIQNGEFACPCSRTWRERLMPRRER